MSVGCRMGVSQSCQIAESDYGSGSGLELFFSEVWPASVRRAKLAVMRRPGGGGGVVYYACSRSSCVLPAGTVESGKHMNFGWVSDEYQPELSSRRQSYS